jgi:uncharacterized protein
MVISSQHRFQSNKEREIVMNNNEFNSSVDVASLASVPFSSVPNAPESDVFPKAQKKKGGFAALSPERVREIASKGGKSAWLKGTAHKFAVGEEASRNGKKGGLICQANKRTKKNENV